MTEGSDFLVETMLEKNNPVLHNLFTESVFSIARILDNYVTWFPTFTDHSALHAMQVINFCNYLIGPTNIDKLNDDELYILLMGCYLHDSGMGVSKEDFWEFNNNLHLVDDPDNVTNDELKTLIRKNHHELSGEFIKKYADFFEIPSEAHLFGVVQLARGHRKTDLFDEKEYPTALPLPSGNTANLAYLSVLIRLADEIDIAVDRNPIASYSDTTGWSEKDFLEFGMHYAIKHMDICPNRFMITVETDDDKIREGIKELAEKVSETLDYCQRVVNERTDFVISQKSVEFTI